MFSLSTAGAALAAEEFTIVTKTVESEDIDVDDDGEFSAGDQSVFSDDIEGFKFKEFGKNDDGKNDDGKNDDHKNDDGKNDDGKIGTVGGVCTATRVDSDDDFQTECQVIYDLPKGQIITKALLDEDDFDEGEFKAAIIGGTGLYKNASGEALVELTDDGSEVTFRIDLNEG
ncbi:MAG: allene oxide cyclase barrel-like domain-containing protein [Egibacteraceae bacterium]